MADIVLKHGKSYRSRAEGGDKIIDDCRLMDDHLGQHPFAHARFGGIANHEGDLHHLARSSIATDFQLEVQAIVLLWHAVSNSLLNEFSITRFL